ncbi:MAG TPA: hypothetical protein VKE74_25880 [Gemmataceae bacterium]|nr:hypothetical protein [Gemmataceae bacterium]
MRTRPVLLAAAAAAAGLAVIGTVVAQPPLPSGYTQPKVLSAPSGTLPATTVRPYSDYSSNPPPGYSPRPTSGIQQSGAYQPAPGGSYQPPPGYSQRPATSGGRLTQPVVAGPDGVKPAGGSDIPPPSLDVPTFRNGPGVPPLSSAGASGGPSLPSPSLTADPPETKFPVLPSPPAPNVYPDPKPAAPTLPTPPASPPAPTEGNTGLPTAPPVPTLPVPTGTNPNPLPQINPTGPAAPTNPTPTAPANPTAPGGNPATAPAAAPAAGMLPNKAAPCVVVEAVSPESVVFGQEYQYKLVVRNSGQVAVSQVRVEDELPPGARFIVSDPPAEQNGDRLVWLLGGMDAGAEKVIFVRVKPTEEGEIRSRATVLFASAVDARTRVTRPRLSVAVNAVEVCRAGEETTFQIKVTNGGTGPATKMILQARLTDGLVHSQGMVIEAELANLPAGESRSVPLKVNAARAGLQACEIIVAADGSPDAKARAAVNVVEPMLVVKQSGPAKCLVRAEPTYLIELSNPGTAATDPVQVHCVLPDGFEYLSASDGGSLNGRTVSWKLPSLAAGSNRSVTLKLRAVAAADGLLRTLAQAGPQAPAGVLNVAGGPAVRPAARGLEAKAESPVSAEGVAAVRFEVIDIEDPVEVGKEAVYEIRVTNQGTGPCTNIQIAAALAEGTEFVGLGPNPPTQVKVQGQGLVFDPIPSLGVKGEAIYRVRVRGLAPGDLRFRVQLTCDQLRTPVIKEESTRFYKE